MDQEFFLRSERLTLRRSLAGYSLRTADRLTYHLRDVGRPNDEHVLGRIENSVGDAVELPCATERRSELRRLDTVPSAPSRAASANTRDPSPRM